MRPTLAEGDLLWLSYRRPVSVGAIVVARLPDGVVAVKRAAERRAADDGAPRWWLLSDDPDRGVDSRHRGAVDERDVQAVAVARLWPRPRRLV